MRVWHSAALVGLSLVVVFSVSRPLVAGRQPAMPEAADPASGAQARPTAQHVEALIAQLGSAEFAAREQATRELIALGIATREPLERATQHPDAEIRARARTILATVCETDFQARLAAFSADYDGRQQRTLPAWGQFSAEYGSGRLSRQLFVEMQRAEPELLEALAEGPKAASLALAERTEQLLGGGGNTLSTLGTQAALLFVASSEGVDMSHHGSLNVYSYIVQSMYQAKKKSPLWPSVLRKLVGCWLAKDNTPAAAMRNLIFATQLELTDEALIIAERILRTAESPVTSRQMAILITGRFGKQQHWPVLEKQLGDDTSCGVPEADQTEERIELEIRDVALATLVFMTGQDMRAYGFAADEPFGQTDFQVGSIGFADAQARDAAFAKWAKWRAEHPAG